MTRIANATKAPTSATAGVGCGLVILTISVLFIPKNVRDVSILLNRGDFVRDEFEVEYFRQGRKSHWLGVGAAFWLTGAQIFRWGVRIAKRSSSPNPS